MKPQRKRKCVTLDLDVWAYIEQRIKDGTYYNFSHALNQIVKEKMSKEKGV